MYKQLFDIEEGQGAAISQLFYKLLGSSIYL